MKRKKKLEMDFEYVKHLFFNFILLRKAIIL